MTTVVLVQAQPRLPSSGAVVTVRVAGGGSAGRPYTQLGVNDWRGGIASVPRFSTAIGFDQNGLTGGAVPQVGAIRIFPSDKAYASALGNLNWRDARLTLSIGDDEAVAPAYPTRLVGVVAAARAEGGALTITVSDLSAALDKPVAPDTFAGTGDLEGGDDATGRVKRRSWGYVFNVEGRILDKAYNVWEFGDPNRPLNAFAMLKDKGVAYTAPTVIAWQGSALATLNALRAATPAQGSAAVAPSIAAAKPWTTPAGPLTADLKGEVGAGYVETALNIAATLVTLYAPTIDLSALAATQSWPRAGASAGLHVDDASETAANAIDRVLLPVSVVWVLDAAGAMRFSRLAWTPAVETLFGETITREETLKPLRTRRVGFQRNHRVHTDAEISAALLTATDVTYADGTPIEVLKPAEAGANVTEQRTAAAILGQGAFATVNSAGYGSPLLTGFGVLAPRDNVYFGSSYLLEGSGGSTATLNAFKTALGQAASFFGQGSLATLSSLTNGGPYLLGFGLLSSRNYVKIGGDGIGADSSGLLTSQGNSTSDATVLTALGTAAAFAGQGLLATLSSLDRSGGYLTGFGFLAGSDRVNLGIMGPGGIANNANTAWLTEPDLVTNQGQAASFYGQGALATRGSVTYGDGYIFGFAQLATRSYIKIGGDNIGSDSFPLLTSDGGATSNSTVLTALGTAASIAGQGAFATLNSAGYGSPYLTGFSYLATQSFVQLETTTIRRADGSTTVTENAVITTQGIAASFYGQGALATQNTATGDQVVGGAVRNADSSVVWDLADASGRKRITKNGYRLVEGAAFGTNGDLVQWYGPTSIAYGSETKTNGVFALATDGKVYYGTAELGTGAGGGAYQQTAAYNQTIMRAIEAGASVTFQAQVYREGGTQAGSLTAQVVGGPAGQGGSVIASGPGTAIGPGEPGGDQVSGTFTNTTGTKQVFSFYVTDSRQPSNAGGAIRASLTYLIL